MTSIPFKALLAIKLLVLIVLWSIGQTTTAIPLPQGALARVQSHNADAGDLFGASVALSRGGEVLVVGADLEASRGHARDIDLIGAGAVHVFRRNGKGWQKAGHLKAPVPGLGAGFGFSVAVSDDGTTIAVGAPFETVADANLGEGAVHVFQMRDAQWAPVVHWRAPAGVQRFGVALDMSDGGDVLAVAAASVGPEQSAQVHLYARRSEQWVANSVLTHAGSGGAPALPRIALAGHGRRVALADGRSALVQLFDHDAQAGRWLAVGAPSEDGAAPIQAMAFASSGQILTLARADGRVDVQEQVIRRPRSIAWTRQALLGVDRPSPGLGRRLAMAEDGRSLVIDGADDERIVHRYVRRADDWHAMPALSTGRADVEVPGVSLALSPDGATLAVGVRFETARRGGWPFGQVPATGVVHLMAARS